jgi:hypothetical protein
MYSAKALRWGLLIDPSRSLRNPDWPEGKSGLPLTTFGLGPMTSQSRTSFEFYSVIGCSRCPVSIWIASPDYARYYVAGVSFPVGLLSLRLLTICVLSQAGRLGGLHHASPVPFRASFFTLHSIMQRYGPTAHRLPAQAMEFSTHYIIAPRGARRTRNQQRMRCPNMLGRKCNGASGVYQ